MRAFPATASDEELLEAVDEWVELLAQERYGEALATFGSREHWTPELLRQVIRGYGFPEPHPSGTVFRVTSRRDAAGKQHYRQVDRWPDPNLIGAVGIVQYDLPLNGKWSDVTALFDVLSADDLLELRLDDIHVL